jgi:hypothetical protein
MIISLLVTGYVVYLYFKLKAEEHVEDAPQLDSVAELKSAVIELDSRVKRLLDDVVERRNEKGAPPC